MNSGAASQVSASRAILLAVGILGLLVVVLSFMPWMTYYYARWVSVSGTEMKGFTDAGDGWVTTTAGAAAGVVAILALLSRVRGQIVASAIAVCGLVISTITWYDLLKPWDGPRPGFLGFEIIITTGFEIRREPALWAVAVAGLAIAVGGVILLAFANRRTPFADDQGERGDTRAWA